MILRVWFFLWLMTFGWATPALTAHADGSSDLRTWVVRVEARRPDGWEIGSAVPISAERVVTNCHVVRGADQVRVTLGNQRWIGRIESGDGYRDLCVVRVPGFSGPVPVFADPKDVHVGTPVRAVGYSGGRFSVGKGTVRGLHTVFSGGRVIQTSAPFDPGASGGGLFDGEGRLVGILTFKSEVGGSFHFALPIAWVKDLERQPVASSPARQAFWEQTGDGAYFLRACALEAKGRWQALESVAQDWVAIEPANPEAWMRLGRARLALGRRGEAVPAFRHALDLDGTYLDAWQELQKILM